MERHFTTDDESSPAPVSTLASENASDVAAQLGQVAHLVCSVKGQLTTMRDRLEIPLSGFDVPAAQVSDLPCASDTSQRGSGSGEASARESLPGDSGSRAFRRFRRAVSQVQILQRGTQMLQKGEGSIRIREQAESEAASFI